MEAIRKKIEAILNEYEQKNEKDLAIATICSHSSLQLLYSAKRLGFKTIGITTKNRKKTYEAFNASKPDEFIVVDHISEFPDSELLARNALVIPHGSLVEYVGEIIFKLEVPLFGNRMSLLWEKDREKMIEWLRSANIKTPKTFKNKDEIDRLCIVKLPGAKGGMGYELVSSPEEFEQKFPNYDGKAVIQEFLVGVRIYPHLFFSPLSTSGYKTDKGTIELLGVDRRIETSADEIYRAHAAGLKKQPSFVVIANEPIVIRESLLPIIFNYSERIIEKSFELFGGMIGPFCLELLVTDTLDVYAFEVSARIVAGTSIFVNSSPYALFTHGEPISMADRIMEEIHLALKTKKLKQIFF